MRTISKSSKLLLSELSELSAIRTRTRSNFAIDQISRRNLSDGALQRKAAAVQQPKSRQPAFRRVQVPNVPGRFSMKGQNLVFEDNVDTPDIDIPSFESRLSRLAENKSHSDEDVDTEYVVIGDPPHWHPVYLRDACPCPRCVDPSTTQKTFQTTDIPVGIRASSIKKLKNKGLEIKWENDVPGFEDHVSVYSKSFFELNRSRWQQIKDRSEGIVAKTWHKHIISANLKSVSYDQWMTDESFLGASMVTLEKSGLLIVRDVPESETSVEEIAKRMGPLRDSFYGRTWDVKSVPEAKNVAYTQKYLGLHMDLLYMADPPGFQFLHCLKNSCEGGESIFVDSFHAAKQLRDHDFNALVNSRLSYQYRNAGEHYFHRHPVIETIGERLQKDEMGVLQGQYGPTIKYINYSPPFQAPTHISSRQVALYPRMLRALRRFAERIENPENVFEYKLKPGECVIFNNRRVLHGRKEFDAVGGERWLKGAYVDTDAFKSRLRVHVEATRIGSVSATLQTVFPELLESFNAFNARGGAKAAAKGEGEEA